MGRDPVLILERGRDREMGDSVYRVFTLGGKERAKQNLWRRKEEIEIKRAELSPYPYKEIIGSRSCLGLYDVDGIG